MPSQRRTFHSGRGRRAPEPWPRPPVSYLLNVRIEQRLAALGLTLPAETRPPPGVRIRFRWARVRDNRVFLSGHGPVDADGVVVGPFGKVPIEVSLEDAESSARRAALAMFGSLKRSLGDLDRVTAWLTINGMVNAEPGYPHTTAVMNAFSELVLDVFGPVVGEHARTAIGVAALPFNLPVVVSAEVEIAP